jgi:RNase P subunit RPR2
MRNKWVAECCEKCEAMYVMEEYVVGMDLDRVLAHVCLDCGHIKPLIVLPLHSPPHPLPERS